jgi:hypothetical protein
VLGDFKFFLKKSPKRVAAGLRPTPIKYINKLINQPNFQVWLVLVYACPNVNTGVLKVPHFGAY